MKKFRTLTVLLVLLLAGCGWDMTAAGWAQAKEMCSQFGGVVAADEAWDSGGWRGISAKCANGIKVSRYFSRSELTNASKDR